jgi:hypothetical protein
VTGLREGGGFSWDLDRHDERTVLSYRRFHSDPEIQRHLDGALRLRAAFLRTCFRAFVRWSASWLHVSPSLRSPRGMRRPPHRSIDMMVGADDAIALKSSARPTNPEAQ